MTFMDQDMLLKRVMTRDLEHITPDYAKLFSRVIMPPLT